MLVVCFANNAVLWVGGVCISVGKEKAPLREPDLMPRDLVVSVEGEKAVWKSVYLGHGSDTCSVGYLKQARQGQMLL